MSSSSGTWPYEVSKLMESQTPFVIVRLVEVFGSSPQDIGACMIVTEAGIYFGTIGGGKIEARAIGQAQEMLSFKTKFDFKKWNLQRDIGMTCGGVMGLSFESFLFESSFQVAIFGAGHVANSLVKLLAPIDCQIFCFDSRPEWLSKIIDSPNVVKQLIDPMEDAIDSLHPQSFIVSLTMGHSFDRPILKNALQKNFPFVGVIGSSQKAKVLRQELEEMDGLSTEIVSKLVCPIGESFGTNAPYEIALSITAQILKKRDELVSKELNSL